MPRAEKKKQAEPTSWVVRIRATVIKEVVVEDCSEFSAREDTYGQTVAEEREVDQSDFEVLSVEPNI